MFSIVVTNYLDARGIPSSDSIPELQVPCTDGGFLPNLPSWLPLGGSGLSSVLKVRSRCFKRGVDINFWRFKIRGWPVLTTLARICSDYSRNRRRQPDSPQWGCPRTVAGGTQEPEHLWTHRVQRTGWMAGQWPGSSVEPQWKLRDHWCTGHASRHPWCPQRPKNLTYWGRLWQTLWILCESSGSEWRHLGPWGPRWANAPFLIFLRL